eukprot:403353520
MTQRNVNNPIPKNTKTIMDILPEPSSYLQYQDRLVNSPLEKSRNIVLAKQQSNKNNQHFSNQQYAEQTLKGNPKKKDLQNYGVTSPQQITSNSEPLYNNKDETIQKLKEVNEKFRQRVQELEFIVKDALDKIENPNPQNYSDTTILKAEKNFFSHRISVMENNPEIAERNAALKFYQQQINQQKANIQSLRNRIEAISNIEKNTDKLNQVLDLERMNKASKKIVRKLSQRNDEQFKVLETLNNDTEYGKQIEESSKELQKWKDKYKMLQQYKKEEDQAFKSKFDYLMQVEDEKNKLKEKISLLKFAPVGSVQEDLDGEIQVKSLTTKRGKSVSLLKKDNSESDNLEQIVKQRDAIEKVLVQNQRRYQQVKRDYENQCENLVSEIENLKEQIVNTERANELYFSEVKELRDLNNTLVAQQQQNLRYSTNNQTTTDEEYNTNQYPQDQSYTERKRRYDTNKQRNSKSRGTKLSYDQTINGSNLSVSKSQNNLSKFKAKPSQPFIVSKNTKQESDKQQLYQTIDSITDRNNTSLKLSTQKFSQSPQIKDNQVIFRYDNQEKLGVSAMNPLKGGQVQNQRLNNQEQVLSKSLSQPEHQFKKGNQNSLQQNLLQDKMPKKR